MFTQWKATKRGRFPCDAEDGGGQRGDVSCCGAINFHGKPECSSRARYNWRMATRTHRDAKRKERQKQKERGEKMTTKAQRSTFVALLRPTPVSSFIHLLDKIHSFHFVDHSSPSFGEGSSAWFYYTFVVSMWVVASAFSCFIMCNNNNNNIYYLHERISLPVVVKG